MIVGHRGAAALAPENTLAGMEKAADLGCQWIETDTHLSADNIPVIFHDQTVDRCTNGTGKVEELSLQALKRLDAGHWFNPEFTGESIPTLKELLVLCQSRGVGVNLELKIYNDQTILTLVEQVKCIVEELQFDEQQLLLSSFSLDAVRECQRVLPDVRVGLITEDATLSYLEEIQSLNVYSVHVDHKILTETMARTLLDLGYELNIWTLNDPSKAKQFDEFGVTHIITDDPSLF